MQLSLALKCTSNSFTVNATALGSTSQTLQLQYFANNTNLLHHQHEEFGTSFLEYLTVSMGRTRNKKVMAEGDVSVCQS